jgi:transposase InsO family protein
MSEGMHFVPTKVKELCIPCCRAKLTKKPFGHGNNKAEQPFQVIFADLWEPMQPTPEGFTYALLIVDDFTSYTWVNLLQRKSETEDYMIKFNERQERSGNMIQEIRTDRGEEFSSARFKKYFSNRGVVLRQSPPYTPQNQGKVERMNRTVGEMAHSMRVAARMHLKWWGVAWGAAVYLHNRCPTKSNVNSMTHTR